MRFVHWGCGRAGAGSAILKDRQPFEHVTLNRTTLNSSTLNASTLNASTAAQKRKALWMVVAFTLLASAAQVLIKTGANTLNQIPPGAVEAVTLGSIHLQISATILAGVTSFPLIGGLALYGIGAAMMVLALRHGELSVLYPVISLSYVWVAILSVAIFHEHMNAFRVAGICVIIAGVAILGRSGSR
jgi:drug/metabolite transporter (DMT)-like permease